MCLKKNRHRSSDKRRKRYRIFHSSACIFYRSLLVQAKVAYLYMQCVQL